MALCGETRPCVAIDGGRSTLVFGENRFTKVPPDMLRCPVIGIGSGKKKGAGAAIGDLGWIGEEEIEEEVGEADGCCPFPPAGVLPRFWPLNGAENVPSPSIPSATKWPLDRLCCGTANCAPSANKIGGTRPAEADLLTSSTTVSFFTLFSPSCMLPHLLFTPALRETCQS